MAQLPDALYEPDGDALVATGLTRGPWDPDSQHGGPPAALLARAVARAAAIAPGQAVRLSFDILRPVPIAALRIETRVLRPGRRVEQLEATLLEATSDAPLMRVNVWRMRAEETALPDGLGAPDPPPAPPEQGGPLVIPFWREEIAYHAALEWRFIDGGFDRPGPATCWTRMKVPLVAGEQPTPLERLLVMADAASGISATLDWTRWTFLNVDLGIHLERPPAGEWTAMRARTRPGPLGAGQCAAVLYDERGRVGMSTQSLLVAPR